MPNRSNNIHDGVYANGTDAAGQISILPPAGYYDGISAWTRYYDADFIASNIKAGVNIIGLTGTAPTRFDYSTIPANPSLSGIVYGFTFSDSCFWSNYLSSVPYRYDINGTLLSQLPFAGSYSDIFCGIDDNYIYGRNSGLKKIRMFDRNSTLINSFGLGDYGNEVMSGQVVGTSANRIFVQDNTTATKEKYDKSFTFLGSYVGDILASQPKFRSTNFPYVIITDSNSGGMEVLRENNTNLILMSNWFF